MNILMTSLWITCQFLIVSLCEFCSEMLKTIRTSPSETPDFKVEEVDRMYTDILQNKHFPLLFDLLSAQGHQNRP